MHFADHLHCERGGGARPVQSSLCAAPDVARSCQQGPTLHQDIPLHHAAAATRGDHLCLAASGKSCAELANLVLSWQTIHMRSAVILTPPLTSQSCLPLKIAHVQHTAHIVPEAMLEIEGAALHKPIDGVARDRRLSAYQSLPEPVRNEQQAYQP